ncbi:hypothetical protein, partial [Brevundimonas naejangsanensis]|uniref:hypothetical protein n=1 Tax=Brevundimonas naejangsanensis TaxID=588932 RepID=UPI0026E9A2FD
MGECSRARSKTADARQPSAASAEIYRAKVMRLEEALNQAADRSATATDLCSPIEKGGLTPNAQAR